MSAFCKIAFLATHKLFSQKLEMTNQLKNSLKDYFEFYNYEQLHSTHGGKMPAEMSVHTDRSHC